MSNVKSPKIRFKGFTDDWEQRKLGNKMYIKSRIGWQALTKSEYLETGDYYLITGTDIDEDNHVVDLKRCCYVSKERYEMDDKIQVHEGDIIVTKDGTIGKVAMVTGLDKPATLNSHLFVLRDMSGTLDNRFLLQVLSSHIFDDFVESTKTGSTLTGLPQKTFVEFKFSAPKIDEQKKISGFLDNIDNLITLHQRKYEKLKNIKQSMLEKMFPKNSENFPEIRFKGFTDAWEQRKFGDIGSVSMCKRIFKEQTSEYGDIPFYKIGTFGGQPDAFIDRKLYEEYKKKFSFPDKGDILLSASGTIGRIVEYDGADAYFQDSNIVWLSHDDTVTNKFLKVLYPIVKWDGIEGSTIQRLYNDNFLKTSFWMPSRQEQEKIGNFFECLDNLITLHQRKYEKLIKIKKSFLQKIFI